MKKRCLALLLALVMILPAALACGKTDEPAVTTTTTAADTTTAPVVETTVASETNKYEIGDELPELNYNGTEVHFISRGRTWSKDVIDVENLTGEVINDAVYNRNAAVEDRLGIKIVDHKDSGSDDYEITKLLRTQVPSGSSDYDVICTATYTMLEAATSNLFQNLLEVEYMDMTRPYWSRGINEATHVGTGQYIATGAISMAYYRFIFATFFNKNLFDEYKVDYPYAAVDSGKWTIDYQHEIGKAFYADLNGNNVSDAADRFGYAHSPDGINSDAYWSACELAILEKDADNMLVFVADKEKIISAVETINSLIWDDSVTWRTPKQTLDAEQPLLIKIFTEDRAAMTTLRLIEVETEEIRGMESLYGIVPVPKGSEEQTEYHSHIHDNTDSFAIPLTTSGDELEMVGALLEAMASEGYRILEPAYYEVALTSKYVSDEDSVRMLDLVIDSLHVDPGFLFVGGTSNFHQNMRTWIGANSKNVASTMAALDRVIAKQMQKLNDSIEAIQ